MLPHLKDVEIKSQVLGAFFTGEVIIYYVIPKITIVQLLPTTKSLISSKKFVCHFFESEWKV